jgi:tryptophan synthase alpha chain
MNGIERISQFFKNNKAFIAYITAGDGGVQHTLDAALALIKGGVNLLEIGIPFSEPVADGPVIQRAAARAIKIGTNLQDILWLVQQIRQHSDIPLVLFSYYNPILAKMQTNFLQEAAKAGVDGLLLVDCPIEESKDIRQACLAQQLAPIYVITPYTPLNRIQQIADYGEGFLYYACRKGTTGMRAALPEDFADKMQMIKANVKLPVITGFGISDKQMAQQVLAYSDGVVVGSLFVKAIEDGASAADLTQLAASINPLAE